MTTDTEKWGRPAPKRKRFAVTQTLRRYASVSNLLRTLGAGTLVAAVLMFLFKGWSSSDDIGRYLMLLAHTVVLTLAGIAMGHWVKESKGARLFLSLSLVSAVVNFAVLGGLVYSQVQWDGGLTLYPHFARWDAGSLRAALGTTGLGFALLVPVALMSFMALARRSALKLTAIFMLAGGALLVPVRDTEYVAVIAGLVTLVLLVAVVRAGRIDTTLSTGEGRFARLIPFSMPALLVGRAMYLYGTDFMIITAVSGLAFLALRQVSRNPEFSDRGRAMLNRLSVLPVPAAAFGLAGLLLENDWMPLSMGLPVWAMASGGLLLEISMRSPHGGAGYRSLAGLVVAVGLCANLWIFTGVPTALAATAAGLVVTVLGHSARQRLVFASGLVTFLVGVLHQCWMAFEAFDFGSWGALAVAGIIAIVSASLLERHGAIVKARLSNWRQSLRQW